MPRIQRKSLVDQVTSGLLGEISSGRYPVGALLPTEPHLAARFSVSRTVLREAISQLRAEGVIETVQGRGTYVASSQQPARIALRFSDELASSLVKIVELRRGLEGEAAQLAAERRRQSHVAAMGRFLERMNVCLGKGDLEGVVDADIDFHREIFKASDNEYLLTMYNHIINLVKSNIKESRRNSFEKKVDPMIIHDEHRAIFEAIRDREGARALLAARRHMDFTATRLVDRMKFEGTDGSG